MQPSRYSRIGSRPMIRLSLSDELYPFRLVKQATQAFDQIAHIEVNPSEGRTVCSFSQCLYDDDQTAREFENYLIDLMGTQRP